MAVVRQSVYGYLLKGTKPLMHPTEVTLTSDASIQEVMTLLGQNGLADGTTKISLSIKSAVPEDNVEMAELLELHFRKELVTFRFRVGRLQVSATGKLSKCTITAGVNKANEFDAEFTGFVDDMQKF